MIRSLFFILLMLLAVSAYCEQDTLSAYEKAADLIDGGDLSGAEAILKAQLAKNKKDYRAMTQLGSAYHQKGDKGRALKYLTDAVKLSPEYPPAHLFLGRLYFAMQKEENAIGEFNTFMDLIRAEPPVTGSEKQIYINSLYYIGDICSYLRRYEIMKIAIDDILRIDPKNQGALYNLGIYHYNGRHDRPKAYSSFKAAIDIDPNTPTAKKAKYAIEFMRKNPDSRISPDLSFINQEYRE